MRKMSATEFRMRCHEIIDDVNGTRETVVITKHGRPVAKLVPAGPAGHNFLGSLAGIIEIVGDIESPVEPTRAWSALR